MMEEVYYSLMQAFIGRDNPNLINIKSRNNNYNVTNFIPALWILIKIIFLRVHRIMEHNDLYREQGLLQPKEATDGDGAYCLLISMILLFK